VATRRRKNYSHYDKDCQTKWEKRTQPLVSFSYFLSLLLLFQEGGVRLLSPFETATHTHTHKMQQARKSMRTPQGDGGVNNNKMNQSVF
jgi:hypothetical protein